MTVTEDEFENISCAYIISTRPLRMAVIVGVEGGHKKFEIPCLKAMDYGLAQQFVDSHRQGVSLASTALLMARLATNTDVVKINPGESIVYANAYTEKWGSEALSIVLQNEGISKQVRMCGANDLISHIDEEKRTRMRRHSQFWLKHAFESIVPHLGKTTHTYAAWKEAFDVHLLDIMLYNRFVPAGPIDPANIERFINKQYSDGVFARLAAVAFLKNQQQ